MTSLSVHVRQHHFLVKPLQTLTVVLLPISTRILLHPNRLHISVHQSNMPSRLQWRIKKRSTPSLPPLFFLYHTNPFSNFFRFFFFVCCRSFFVVALSSPASAGRWLYLPYLLSVYLLIHNICILCPLESKSNQNRLILTNLVTKHVLQEIRLTEACDFKNRGYNKSLQSPKLSIEPCHPRKPLFSKSTTTTW